MTFYDGGSGKYTFQIDFLERYLSFIWLKGVCLIVLSLSKQFVSALKIQA